MSSPAASRSSSPPSRSKTSVQMPKLLPLAKRRKPCATRSATVTSARAPPPAADLRRIERSSGEAAAHQIRPGRRASQFGEPSRRDDVVGVAEGDEVAFRGGHPTVAGVSRAPHVRCPHQARVAPLVGPGARDLHRAVVGTVVHDHDLPRAVVLLSLDRLELAEERVGPVEHRDHHRGEPRHRSCRHRCVPSPRQAARIGSAPGSRGTPRTRAFGPWRCGPRGTSREPAGRAARGAPGRGRGGEARRRDQPAFRRSRHRGRPRAPRRAVASPRPRSAFPAPCTRRAWRGSPRRTSTRCSRCRRRPPLRSPRGAGAARERRRCATASHRRQPASRSGRRSGPSPMTTRWSGGSLSWQSSRHAAKIGSRRE